MKDKGADLCLRIRLVVGDEIAFGPGKADLLSKIIQTGSISAAGRAMGMSYKRAWLLVETMNRCFNAPLVETSKGGARRGGAKVTPLGEIVLAHYREMEQAANAAIERKAEIFPGLISGNMVN